jgi:hypothetical protein
VSEHDRLCPLEQHLPECCINKCAREIKEQKLPRIENSEQSSLENFIKELRDVKILQNSSKSSK